MPQLYRVLGLLVAPNKPCQIAQVYMYRWISIASASLIIHDFPDLEKLFLDHGQIYRWATQGCIVFNTTSLALVMPTALLPGDSGRYAVRQLTPDEINDPGAYFSSVMMQVLQFTSLFPLTLHVQDVGWHLEQPRVNSGPYETICCTAWRN